MPLRNSNRGRCIRANMNPATAPTTTNDPHEVLARIREASCREDSIDFGGRFNMSRRFLLNRHTQTKAIDQQLLEYGVADDTFAPGRPQNPNLRPTKPRSGENTPEKIRTDRSARTRHT